MSYQVGPGTFVTVSFQAFDAEGEKVSDPEVLASVFGLGGMLPGVEQAIEGKEEGTTIEVRLPPEQAFGKRDPAAIVEVDRSDFPPEVSAGDRFEVENEEGGLLVLHVLDVHEEVVVVDTNHPLADQEVKFVVEVREVRPATSEEIEAAEAEIAEESDVLRPDVPLVSPSSLIKGRSER